MTTTEERIAILKDVAGEVLCSATMTVGVRRRSKRAGSSYNNGRPGKRFPCPNKATQVIDGRQYCAMHGPTKFRIDPYYSSKEWHRLRDSVLERDDHTCQYCEKKATQADHVIPRGKGGSDSLRNLVACCPRCNKLASGTLFPSFAKKRSWILAQLKNSRKT